MTFPEILEYTNRINQAFDRHREQGSVHEFTRSYLRLCRLIPCLIPTGFFDIAAHKEI